MNVWNDAWISYDSMSAGPGVATICYGTIMSGLNYVVVGKMLIILSGCRADMCGERRAKAYSGLVPQC